MFAARTPKTGPVYIETVILRPYSGAKEEAGRYGYIEYFDARGNADFSLFFKAVGSQYVPTALAKKAKVKIGHQGGSSGFAFDLAFEKEVTALVKRQGWKVQARQRNEQA